MKEAKEGKLKSQDLNWVFAADRDEHGKPYYQDGNPLLYTDDNLKKRADLRKDPTVVEAIQEVTASRTAVPRRLLQEEQGRQHHQRRIPAGVSEDRDGVTT